MLFQEASKVASVLRDGIELLVAVSEELHIDNIGGIVANLRRAHDVQKERHVGERVHTGLEQSSLPLSHSGLRKC